VLYVSFPVYLTAQVYRGAAVAEAISARTAKAQVCDCLTLAANNALCFHVLSETADCNLTARYLAKAVLRVNANLLLVSE